MERFVGAFGSLPPRRLHTIAAGEGAGARLAPGFAAMRGDVPAPAPLSADPTRPSGQASRTRASGFVLPAPRP